MPVATREAAAAAPRTVRMTLLADEFLSEYPPYRYRAGTVILVDEVTAERWRRIGVAVDSAETDKTAAELKRAERERLDREIAALESGTAVGDVGISPAATTRRPRGR